MKISELQVELEAIKVAHGDLEVVDSYGIPLSSPEEVEGDCVLADTA